MTYHFDDLLKREAELDLECFGFFLDGASQTTVVTPAEDVVNEPLFVLTLM